MRLLRFYAAAIALLGIAAARAQSPTAIVFIHGIKGSVLVDAEGNERWITLAQALGLSSPSLALPLEWEPGGEQKRDGIEPIRVLDRITLVPWVAHAEIYGPLIKTAPKPFHAFAYDWRRDNLETLERFEAFVSKIKSDAPTTRLRLLAHSNGGLIAWALLNRHPDWFESAYFAGVPFAGGVGFLPDLAIGQISGLNSKILAPEILGSFPSVYTFFRPDGRGLAEARFFDPLFWKEQKWGLFKKPLSKAQEKAALDFLAVALPRAARFRQLLVRAPVSYPPLHVILSRATPTLQEVRRKIDGSVDFGAALKAPGDGRVCADDALLPGATPATIHETVRDHSELLNDPAIIRLLSP